MLLIRVRITPVAGQRVRLAQLHEVLVPVQLPRDLLITRNSGIQVVELAPVLERNAFAAYGLEVPVDWLAKTQIFQSQKVKPSIANTIRLRDDLFGRIRPARFQ